MPLWQSVAQYLLAQGKPMADIINLNKARKARAKAEKEAIAAQNRITFGRTKAERTKITAEKQKAEQLLNGHKMDGEDE